MYNNTLYINEIVYYVLLFLLISSYILSFIVEIYFPNNDINSVISSILDWVSILLPIYVSIYLIIMFNSFNGKKYCDNIDIRIIYRSGIIIFITIALPSLLTIADNYFELTIPTEFSDTLI